MNVSTVNGLKSTKVPRTALSVARWQIIAVEDALDQETLAAALEMCRRVLTVRTAGDVSYIEILIDDPLRQQTQIQTVQTILNDQIARQRLQSTYKAEMDAEVACIVKQVSGCRHEC